MKDTKLKIIYEDKDLLVVDKPAGIIVFPEKPTKGETLIDFLLKRFPYLKEVGKKPRYGIVHRLDKETSGILLVAKNDKSLNCFQKQFKERKVKKKYFTLVVGKIKENQGKIETLISRSPENRRKQKVYLPLEPQGRGKRKAITEYNVLKRFKNYTLVTAIPKTGRRHQIRAHFVYLSHPIAGDKLYSFKGQPCPEGLFRQFLHASYLKIRDLDGKEKEFESELPENLKKILKSLKSLEN